MTTEECYKRMGADYEDVIRRLSKEERVRKFLLRVPEDSSFANLCRALEAGDAEEAFRAAHSLKGICLNLGLTMLYQSTNMLTEELRGGKITPTAFQLKKQTQQDYLKTIQCIGQLMED